MISAADRHDVGWPLPASLVERTESIRSWVARFLSVARDVVMAAESPARRGAAEGSKRAVVPPRWGSPHGQKPVRRERSLSRRQRLHRIDRATGGMAEPLFA